MIDFSYFCSLSGLCIVDLSCFLVFLWLASPKLIVFCLQNAWFRVEHHLICVCFMLVPYHVFFALYYRFLVFSRNLKRCGQRWVISLSIFMVCSGGRTIDFAYSLALSACRIIVFSYVLVFSVCRIIDFSYFLVFC